MVSVCVCVCGVCVVVVVAAVVEKVLLPWFRVSLKLRGCGRYALLSGRPVCGLQQEARLERSKCCMMRKGTA